MRAGLCPLWSACYSEPCATHGGAVHGGEAEELRAGIEGLLRSEDHAGTLRLELQKLLDRVDARDSLAYREATDT
jgi:hypothetical protein